MQRPHRRGQPVCCTSLSTEHLCSCISEYPSKMPSSRTAFFLQWRRAIYLADSWHIPRSWTSLQWRSCGIPLWCKSSCQTSPQDHTCPSHHKLIGLGTRSHLLTSSIMSHSICSRFLFECDIIQIFSAHMKLRRNNRVIVLVSHPLIFPLSVGSTTSFHSQRQTRHTHGPRDVDITFHGTSLLLHIIMSFQKALFADCIRSSAASHVFP